MSSYLTLTLRYLRKQWKRSLATMLGISLSLALITGVGVTAESLQQAQVDQARTTYGDYHARFTIRDEAALGVLQNHLLVQSAALTIPLGGHNLANRSVTVSIEGYDPLARDMFGLSLVQGRWPAGDREIAMEDWVLEQMEPRPALGDMVHLNYEQTRRGGAAGFESYSGEAEFTLTGIMKGMTGGRVQSTSLAVVTPETPAGLLPADWVVRNVFTQIKPGQAVRQAVETIQTALDLTDDDLFVNEGLLAALGETGELNWPVIFLGLIVAIATGAVIFNVFHISVLERIQQFGMLLSLGATPRQVRLIVLYEALLLYLGAIPLGLGAGLLLSIGLAAALSSLQSLAVHVVVSVPVLFVAAGTGLAATLVSALQPAWLAGKIPPLAAIRTNAAVRKASRTVRRRWQGLLGRLFGVTGTMAWQNMWRHRTRSVVTIFSLCLGVTLYIVFSYFAASAPTTNIVDQYLRGDYVISTDDLTLDSGYTEADLLAVKQLSGVSAVAGIRYTGTGVLTTPDQVLALCSRCSDQFMPFRPDPETGEVAVDAGLMGLSATGLEELRPLLLAGEFDTQRMAAERSVIVVGERAELRPGDSITLRQIGADRQWHQERLKVTAVVKDSSTVNAQVSIRFLGPILIVHEETFQQVTGSDYYKRLEITAADGADWAELADALGPIARKAPQGTLLSFKEELAKRLAEKRQLMIFFYGIVATITIISAFNIVNTLSSNLILRTRETGTLRAVGLTVAQLTRMTLQEGVFYGLLGALWGIAAGSVLAFVLYLIMRQEMTYLEWAMPWTAIALAGLGSVGITVLATLPPLRRIARLSIIESIRGIE